MVVWAQKIIFFLFLYLFKKILESKNAIKVFPRPVGSTTNVFLLYAVLIMDN